MLRVVNLIGVLLCFLIIRNADATPPPFKLSEFSELYFVQDAVCDTRFGHELVYQDCKKAIELLLRKQNRYLRDYGRRSDEELLFGFGSHPGIDHQLPLHVHYLTCQIEVDQAPGQPSSSHGIESSWNYILGGVTKIYDQCILESHPSVEGYLMAGSLRFSITRLGRVQSILQIPPVPIPPIQIPPIPHIPQIPRIPPVQIPSIPRMPPIPSMPSIPLKEVAPAMRGKLFCLRPHSPRPDSPEGPSSPALLQPLVGVEKTLKLPWKTLLPNQQPRIEAAGLSSVGLPSGLPAHKSANAQFAGLRDLIWPAPVNRAPGLSEVGQGGQYVREEEPAPRHKPKRPGPDSSSTPAHRSRPKSPAPRRPRPDIDLNAPPPPDIIDITSETESET